MTDPALGAIEDQLYAELRRIAGSLRSRFGGDGGVLGVLSGSGSTQRTSLVHEAWLRLAGSDSLRLHGREHLLAVSARVMRFLLVEQARRAHTLKRGEGWQQVALDGIGDAPRFVDILSLDQALQQLQAADERAGQLAELRLIAGASLPEAAQALEIGLRTAERDWRAARAFLVVALELDRG